MSPSPINDSVHISQVKYKVLICLVIFIFHKINALKLNYKKLAYW